MKKLLMTISTILPHFALAWSFNIGPIEVKGNDPKIPTPQEVIDTAKDTIKNVGKEAEKVVQNIGKETEKAAHNIGKETQRVYEKNLTTITHLGRFSACMATYCISEIIRDKEINELKEKQKKELAKAAEALKTQQRDVYKESTLNALNLQKPIILRLHDEIEFLTHDLSDKKSIITVLKEEQNLRQQYADINLDYLAENSNGDFKESSQRIDAIADKVNVTDQEFNDALNEVFVNTAEKTDQEYRERMLKIFSQMSDSTLSFYINFLQRTLIQIENKIVSKKADLVIEETKQRSLQAELNSL